MSQDSAIDFLLTVQKIIQENPDIVSFLETVKEIKELTIPIKIDKLIGQKQASEILGVAPDRISEYVKNGILTAYYTPPVSHRKFWLSEVLAIPRKEKDS